MGVQIVDDLFDGDDGALGGKHGFLLHADNAFDQHIALAVGLLGVDERDIGTDRRHCRQFLAGKGAGDRRMFGLTRASSAPL
jgi:hypothetical protein